MMQWLNQDGERVDAATAETDAAIFVDRPIGPSDLRRFDFLGLFWHCVSPDLARLGRTSGVANASAY
jgi:hypothetical protein